MFIKGYSDPTGTSGGGGGSGLTALTGDVVASGTGSQPATIQWPSALTPGVRCATTAAGTLATDYEDGDTIDDVILATGDLILIKNQVTTNENGVYVVQASGAPVRAPFMTYRFQVDKALVEVWDGTTNGGRIYQQINNITWTSRTDTLVGIGTAWVIFADKDLLAQQFLTLTAPTAGTAGRRFLTDSTLYGVDGGSLTTYTLGVLPMSRGLHYKSDFISSTTIDCFLIANNGAGAAVSDGTIAPTTNAIGIRTLDTGTTTTGRASTYTLQNGFIVTSGTGFAEWRVRIPTLSDGTETFIVRVGIGDSNTAAATDGVYFDYTHSASSGAWVANVRDAGGNTLTTTTGITVAAATWYKLRVEYTATQAIFIIDGVEVVRQTLTLPSGTTGHYCTIVKSAGSTSRTVDIDYGEVLHLLTTPR